MKRIGLLCVLGMVLAAGSACAATADSTARHVAASAADSTVRRTVAPAADSSARRAAALNNRLPAGHPGKAPRLPGKSGSRRDTLSREEIRKLKLPAPPARAKGRPPRVAAVALDVRHRVFASFAEHEIVDMKSEFRIGDSDFTGRILEFVPDFAMGLETFKVYSRSNEPNNPAFRIAVKEKGQPRDTVWAFLNSAPHFARRSMLAFRVMRIEFLDHAPVPTLPSDTAAVKSPAPPPGAKPEAPAPAMKAPAPAVNKPDSIRPRGDKP